MEEQLLREQTKFKQILAAARDSLRVGNPIAALNLLKSIADPADNFSTQAQYSRLASKIGENIPSMPIIRVAFLANSTLEHWVECLRFWLLLEGFRLETYIAPFGSWRQEVFNSASGLYAFSPDFTWFFLTARDVPLEGTPNFENHTAIVEQAAADVADAVSYLMGQMQSQAIVNNAEARSVRILGNYESQVSWSDAAIFRQYNLVLPQKLPPGTVIFDLDYQAARYGLDRWEDSRLWYHSKHPFALDATGPVAFAAARLLSAARGKAKKCIVLDLDNTLWGGVIGDDGINGIRLGPSGGAVGEAYVAFQTFLKKMSARGVALAVCSKNDDRNAREVFQKRSEMVLSLDDFAAFYANWNNKADNIRSLAAELNLGLDSLIFIDDNPAERALIRAELPDIAVPELPLDPSEYINTLANGLWFEIVSLSNEDINRTQAYRANTARRQELANSTKLDDYLSSLEMKATWGKADATRLPRLAQLVNKTNQFHLTTTRYTEAELAALAERDDVWVGWFSLKDRFGDNGVISIVILKFIGDTAYIDTWAMSCRVFSRTMENFIFSIVYRMAQEYQAVRLVGHFIPTPKNSVVKDLYRQLGGSLATASEYKEEWVFDLMDITPSNSPFIADDLMIN